MIIVIDSDGFIGNLDPQDVHHELCKQISLRLSKKDAELIYPATVIAETVTFLQGRLNSPELAEEVINLIKENELIIEPVDAHILQQAGLQMDFKKSKHNTLFDAIVAVIATKYNADAIFSFDKFYKTKGFKLAQEL